MDLLQYNGKVTYLERGTLVHAKHRARYWYCWRGMVHVPEVLLSNLGDKEIGKDLLARVWRGFGEGCPHSLDSGSFAMGEGRGPELCWPGQYISLEMFVDGSCSTMRTVPRPDIMVRDEGVGSKQVVVH
jgi:hypothetical protein